MLSIRQKFKKEYGFILRNLEQVAPSSETPFPTTIIKDVDLWLVHFEYIGTKKYGDEFSFDFKKTPVTYYTGKTGHRINHVDWISLLFDNG
jgi:hypothetical protein